MIALSTILVKGDPQGNVADDLQRLRPRVSHVADNLQDKVVKVVGGVVLAREEDHPKLKQSLRKGELLLQG